MPNIDYLPTWQARQAGRPLDRRTNGRLARELQPGAATPLLHIYQTLVCPQRQGAPGNWRPRSCIVRHFPRTNGADRDGENLSIFAPNELRTPCLSCLHSALLLVLPHPHHAETPPPRARTRTLQRSVTTPALSARPPPLPSLETWREEKKKRPYSYIRPIQSACPDRFHLEESSESRP